jgi:hypothetical protein
MGLYCEVMCDLRISGTDPRQPLNPLCWSDANNNPQGPNPAAARSAARDEGWTLGRGRKAICPGCAAHTKAQPHDH